MQAASLRLRFKAALIDSGVVIGGLAGVLGPLIAAGLLSSRIRVRWSRSEVDAAPTDAAAPADPVDRGPEPGVRGIEAVADRGPSRRMQAGVWTAGLGLAVVGRNWRSPGARALGLRRVDARTGGPVSVRSALVGFGFDQMRQVATRRLFGSRVHRGRERLRTVQPRQKAIQEAYAQDPVRQQRALMDLYKEAGVTPFEGCGWRLAGVFASQLISLLGMRGERTIFDRVTGTVVIVAEGSRST